MISILTPTGARPEAFAVCVEQMSVQTEPGPVRWVIVDDGPEPMPRPSISGWEIVMVRPSPVWRPGWNTLARNLMAGLEYVTDRVVIVEDDDQYAPWWVERCNQWLDQDDLVGESHSVYRHVSGAKCEGADEYACGNDAHASLCSTALRGDAIETLRDVCRERSDMIDIRLWRARPGRLRRPDPRGVVGIKGYPGRRGIGIGHQLWRGKECA